MVVTTGEFEYQTGEWGILDDRPEDWHKPFPNVYFKPKVLTQHAPTKLARYRHKGSHRAADRNLVQWLKNLTIRFAVLVFAVYYYFAVALVLKGADAAERLFQIDTALACATGISFVAYLWQRRRLAHKKKAQAMRTVWALNATSDSNGFVRTWETRTHVVDGVTRYLPVVTPRG